MQKRVRLVYEFGPFRFIPEQRLLLREGQPLPLTLKTFDILHVLVQNRGDIVGKDKLMKEVWPEQIVEESNLTQHISILRRILGENPRQSQYIETVQRYGYRFIAEVKELQDGANPQAIESESFVEFNKQQEQESRDEPLRPEPKEGGDSGASLSEENRTDTRVSRPSSELPSFSSRLLQGSHSKKAFVLVSLVIVGISLGLVLRGLLGRSNNQSRPVNPRLTKLTNTGNVRDAAISPDGKYIAYVVEDVGQYSIWVRQVNTTSAFQVVSAVKTILGGLNFSGDGNFIYYVTWPPNNSNTLYQVPLFGGASKEIIARVDSDVTVSPDGGRLAFVRRVPEKSAMALFIANADGTDEQLMAMTGTPMYFVGTGPAWSPDGKMLVCVAATRDKNVSTQLIGVQVADKAQVMINSPQLTHISKVAWLRDGSGLIALARRQGARFASALQIWHLSYPEGEARMITNDLNDYRELSLTTDSQAIVTVQNSLISNISVTASNGDMRPAQQVSVGSYDGYYGLSWQNEDRIVYASNITGDQEIWSVGTDGSKAKQLTVSNSGSTSPTVSPDRRTIVFASTRNGSSHIWRMDIDGNQQYQLTDGRTEMGPQISPDGKFVVYTGSTGNGWRIWKIPIEGGDPVRLIEARALMPSISPDGSQIACYYLVEQPKPQWNLALIPFTGGPPIKIFALPEAVDPYLTIPPMRWSSDGRALIYVDSRSGVSNLWRLPLDGGEPTQITNFKDSQIFSYDWTRDGKRLVISRGNTIGDAIIIRDFN